MTTFFRNVRNQRAWVGDAKLGLLVATGHLRNSWQWVYLGSQVKILQQPFLTFHFPS